ncbi:hypothetical protein O181_023717 [Austropuccinia psidii MF-1]|uniref:Uncharacterized protein n=1 Tax=Austropuccinia psidii MF-1 TaxID=1389203 RepID=A0A9Q3GY99_9BASI|nr:hypothetical protein [Austropuccinia psidii MF-1]
MGNFQNPSARACNKHQASSASSNVKLGQDVETFDSSIYFNISLLSASPLLVNVALVASILFIFKHNSCKTVSWILAAQRDELQLAYSTSDSPSHSKALPYTQKALSKSIPLDIMTIIQCSAPSHCRHRLNGPVSNQGTHLDPANELDKADTESGDDMDFPACNAPLFKACINPGKPTAFRHFARQSFLAWLARFFSSSGVEEALDASWTKFGLCFDPCASISDINDSKVWKEFQDLKGNQYTSHSGNLTFEMYMDGINPFGNSHGGNLCFLPENIFIFGISPGPKEPTAHQVNWVLRPLVDQLKILWNPGLQLSKTSLYPHGRHIHCAILPFIGDLPTLWAALGFASHSATRMCLYCHLKRSEIQNLDYSTWPKRTLSDHRKSADDYLKASNAKVQDKLLKENGVRYSVLVHYPISNGGVYAQFIIGSY